MSIKKQTDIIKSKLTDRCVYTDCTGHILHTGDICLFFDKSHRKQVKFDNYVIGIFFKDTVKSMSKIIYGANNKSGFLVKSLVDKDYFNKTNKFAKPFSLSCFVGDFSKMDEDFLNRVNYKNAMKAYTEFFQKVNKHD